MKQSIQTFKPKKFVGKLLRICFTCGSEKISLNEFTVSCQACGTLNYYEGVGS